MLPDKAAKRHVKGFRSRRKVAKPLLQTEAFLAFFKKLTACKINKTRFTVVHFSPGKKYYLKICCDPLLSTILDI